MPSYVQQQFGDANSTLTVTLGSNTGSGNTIVVCFSIGTTYGSLTSFSDADGHTYTLRDMRQSPDGSNGHSTQWIYDTINIAGGTTNAVTVTCSGGALIEMQVTELSNAGYMDQVLSAGGTATTVDSGSITTTQPTEIILGMGSMTSGGGANFSAQGSSYTNIAIGSQVVGYKNVTSIGTYDADATGSASTSSWVMAIITYAASAPTPNIFRPDEDYLIPMISVT